MKTLLLSLAAVVLLFVPATLRAQDAPPPPPDAQGGPGPDDQGASFQTFYDQLGNDGNWIQTDDYGPVFQPNVQDPNWAPYTQGGWVYTDDGWTWVSDEPWGWATYHYGRWANIDGLGWVWVPGYRWAPAWVSWRFGGGYCGWAPLPPGADDGDADFHFGDDCDVSFDIGPGCYNFIAWDNFGDPNCGRYVVNRYRNYSIINNTRNVTNFNVGRGGGGGRFGGVFAGGPTLAEANAHGGHRFTTMHLSAANDPQAHGVRGNTVAVFAPQINPATAHQGQPPHVSRTISHPTFNHGSSITHPLDVTATVKPPPPGPSLIAKAKQAQAHVPATAKIAGAGHHPATTTTAVQGSPAFTGQPIHQENKAAETFHPETANTGEPVHAENKPAETFHPETANTGEPVHAENKPAETFHPETANMGEPVHPENKPAETFHPETANTGAPAVHHEEEAPHHEEEVHHAEPSAPKPEIHAENKPAPKPENKPAPSGGGGGKPDDKNKKP